MAEWFDIGEASLQTSPVSNSFDACSWMQRALMVLLACLLAPAMFAAERDPRIGIAGHAFDHLGNLGERAGSGSWWRSPGQNRSLKPRRSLAKRAK
jgi:hypothetical protein